MNAIAKVEPVGVIEQALVQGNLANLSPEQRASHYLRVCESLGLNPHTQPLDYITLQGKLTLYAKRSCTDQLRKIYGVSVIGLPTKTIEDGILTVTVRVKDGTGREDVDEGAVCIAGLKGDALANAHMKAITKAKRRATLSLCGLGWLDESEIETIPNAQVGEPSEPKSTLTTEAATKPSPVKPPPVNGSASPINLESRLKTYEAKLVSAGTCKPGELLTHVREQGVRVNGYPANMDLWSESGVTFAADVAKEFVAVRQKPAPPAKQDSGAIAFNNALDDMDKEYHEAGVIFERGDFRAKVHAAVVKAGAPESVADWTEQHVIEGKRLADQYGSALLAEGMPA